MNKAKYDPNRNTIHGDNIANQIQTEDAYGYDGMLTPTDLWNILDNFQTHCLDTDRDNDATFVGELMNNVLAKYPDIEI